MENADRWYFSRQEFNEGSRQRGQYHIGLRVCQPSSFLIMNNSEMIAEINQHIKDALAQWSYVCLSADADNWSFHLQYDGMDVLNVTQLFMHVCSNIGIKNGRIGEKAAQVYGERIRDLVQSMTGFDTWKLADAMPDGLKNVGKELGDEKVG